MDEYYSMSILDTQMSLGDVIKRSGNDNASMHGDGGNMQIELTDDEKLCFTCRAVECVQNDITPSALAKGSILCNIVQAYHAKEAK